MVTVSFIYFIGNLQQIIISAGLSNYQRWIEITAAAAGQSPVIHPGSWSETMNAMVAGFCCLAFEGDTLYKKISKT